jgi:uncharacterized protein (TIGR02118 family)
MPNGSSSVLYPNGTDLIFDMEYYLTTHMPLVAKIWGPHGLQSWKVIQLFDHPDGTRAPYCVQCILTWSKLTDVEIITKTESDPVFADIKNFTSEKPIFIAGMVAGEATV